MNNIKEELIEELELDVRTYNCLKRAGINTVGDLCNRTKEDMMRARNLGRKTLDNLLIKMKLLGLEFKES
jgi:DNA-directed RNA polymerase subunit alpha